jgi:hypothetical protein
MRGFLELCGALSSLRLLWICLKEVFPWLK